MPILRSNKQGHRGGAWFTTDKTEVPDLGVGGMVGGGGGLGDAVLMLALLAVFAFVVSVAAYVFRFWRTTDAWGRYSGLIFCQIHGDDLRFYKTLRGTSRAVLKPPAVTRSIASLAKFRTYTSDTGKLFFEFSDGLEIELYFVDGDLTEFREAVSLMLEQHRKSARM